MKPGQLIAVLYGVERLPLWLNTY